MTIPSTEELDRLHRLISWELSVGMSPAAAAGEACVRCEAPADETAVRLERDGTPWKACVRCYIGRLAWLISWYDWHQHVTACDSCKQARTCYVGHGRRLLHTQTIGPAGKRPAHCCSCHRPVQPTELAVAVRWEGESRDHLGYAHARCLSRRGALDG